MNKKAQEIEATVFRKQSSEETQNPEPINNNNIQENEK